MLFFFSSRRRHTIFDCDWSSDVCSSDLVRSGSLICRILLLMEESEMKNSEKANKRFDHCGFTSRLLFGAAAICVFTVISVATASADNSSHRRPIALTESGLVIGSTTDGGNEFLGIPYAAPPVGALLWRPPKRY